MDFNFWFTLLIFIVLSVFLFKEILPTEIAIFSALILLVTADVINIKEAFSGFSNEGMLTIAILFVVAGALQSTGAIENISKSVFGKKKLGIPSSIFRISIFSGSFSAFLNNTPIVAMLIPTVKNWAESNDISPSKLLIPLSYATILGGMCTLIGTSTNLVVHGLLINNGNSGFSFFELSPIGIPIAIAGIAFMTFFGGRLLPNRKTPDSDFTDSINEYVVELKITEEYPKIGMTIEEAGLRHLQNSYLFQIERNGEILAPAKPKEKLKLNDRLFFTGTAKKILELQKTPGLQLIKESDFDLKNYDSDDIKTFEAVISHNSVFVNKTPKEINFRDYCNAVIIAIHRNGERINKKIGETILRPGDTLLLLAEKNFKNKWRTSTDFYLISESDEIPSKPKWHTYLSLLLFITMVVLATLNVLPLINAMAIAAIILVISGTIKGENVFSMIDWKVLLVIASSFGIAIAIEKSGVGRFFSEIIIGSLEQFGPIAIVAGVYFVTAIYTSIITNNTAALLMFPIALASSVSTGIDIHVFALAIAIGASSSFITPISYQTNLMVYGPGGYKYTDFLRLGIPLQIITGVIAVLIIWQKYM